jgi:hypothetical protein
MTDQLATELISRLNPFLYVIGLVVVLGFVSFGGTILSWYFKSKEKRDDSILSSINENTIAIARLEAKLDLFVQRHEKDINAIGDKVRRLEV